VALVDETDIRTYESDGFVALRNVLPQHILEMLQQGVDKNLASPSSWANDYTPENSSGRFFDDYVSWQRISEFADAALHTVLPRIAGKLMKTSSPRFFHEHVLVKEPGTVTPTPVLRRRRNGQRQFVDTPRSCSGTDRAALYSW
jgi:hypothetical protein